MGGNDRAECEWGGLLMSNYLVDGADLTSVANAIRAKSGGSSQLAFPAGFVSEIQAIPSGGGGGATLVASGTYTGAGAVNVDIPIGKKCPETDFLFLVCAEDGATYQYSNDYQVWDVSQFVMSPDRYDLSSDGTKQLAAITKAYSDKDGVITALKLPFTTRMMSCIRVGSMYWSLGSNVGYNRIKRGASGFSISLQNWSNAWYFVSGMTYNWKVIYFGSDPDNDIVEVP